MLALVLAAMAGAVRRRNHPRRKPMAVRHGPARRRDCCSTLALAGCGGAAVGAVEVQRLTPEHPPEPTRLTVTGTTGSGSSALSHTVTLTLTVS